MPANESQSLLYEWYQYGDRGTWAQRESARVAAMLLAKIPTPNFVASVLRDAAQTLHISVYNTPNHGDGFGAGSSCGDGVGGGVPTDWPPTSSYFLEENSPNANQILVQLGSDRISYNRVSFYGGYGSCYGVTNLDDTTRHRLLAYWLELDPRDMAWHPNEFISIVYESQTAYEAELGHIIEQHRRLLLRTAQDVYARTHAGDALPDSYIPQLHVLIHCAEKPCRIDGQ